MTVRRSSPSKAWSAGAVIFAATAFGIALASSAENSAKPSGQSDSSPKAAPATGNQTVGKLPAINFNRDIRPILSNNCFACHGPDGNKRQADLRLDLPDEARKVRPEGHAAIVPGNSGKSELVRRLTDKDPDRRMPPAGSDKKLSQEQIDLLTRWVNEGAEYRGHWAFIKPEPVQPPAVGTPGEVVNPIDQFVLARLKKEGLSFSPQANKSTLIRRVTLDLTGLPPTLEEVDAFLKDDAPNAYEKVVDRLLKSPRYGEHMARIWLDAARYGDTHGLHLDNERSLWPYRDWVIKSFNSNMPFDKFTIDQIAGDLLPNPTLDQLIATGFNRCNVTTSEGGAISDEYAVKYGIDRVETTSTVWMGLTLGCSVCHDHKFDPLPQKDFYRMFAFFANQTENAMDGNALLPPPVIKAPSPLQELSQKKLQGEIAKLEAEIRGQTAKIVYTDPGKETSNEIPAPKEVVWFDDDLPKGAIPEGNGGGPNAWRFVTRPNPVYSGTKSSTRKANGLSQHFFTGANPPLKLAAGDRLFAFVYLDPANPPKEIMLQFNDGSWEHRAYWGGDLIPWGTKGTHSRQYIGPLPSPGQWVRLEVEIEKVGLKADSLINGWAFTQHDGTVYWDKSGVLQGAPLKSHFASQKVWEEAVRTKQTTEVPKPVADAIAVDAAKRNAAQTQQIREYFLERVHEGSRPILAPLFTKLDSLKKDLTDLDASIPSTMIMQEKSTPKEVFVLTRGEYDKPDRKQPVEALPIVSLLPVPKDAPKNRLTLARWLVDPNHPLTARVTVNRYWQQYFGTGLVQTAEDFGVQGEWPSHPDLLDWLALEFIRTGWDVKRMQKLIVMSAAYRQTSRVTPELLVKDRANRLISRGPRFRLDAEMLRDSALAMSGLLSEKIGGKSVKPYQPAGIWESVAFTSSNTSKFMQDKGDALYRRSMYTFWKRTAPPPSMTTFDAPSRETCTVRRPRTNTPLQALAMMNDDQYVEASRHFARRILREGGTKVDDRITFAFRLATSRNPTAEEIKIIAAVHRDQLAEFQKDRKKATDLLSVGESPRDESLDAAELAAWTMVANLILNLDETVTKG